MSNCVKERLCEGKLVSSGRPSSERTSSDTDYTRVGPVPVSLPSRSLALGQKWHHRGECICLHVSATISFYYMLLACIFACRDGYDVAIAYIDVRVHTFLRRVS